MAQGSAAPRKYWPVWHLTLARLKEFSRQPAAIFCVYGFPLLMITALGVAFREDPVEHIVVDLVEGGGPQSAVSETGSALNELQDKLAADPRFELKTVPGENWRKRLQAGKTDLVI